MDMYFNFTAYQYFEFPSGEFAVVRLLPRYCHLFVHSVNCNCRKITISCHLYSVLLFDSFRQCLCYHGSIATVKHHQPHWHNVQRATRNYGKITICAKITEIKWKILIYSQKCENEM